MNRLLRILKHRWYDETDAFRTLDDAALTRLQTHVQSSETQHRGEIRLCIEAGLPLSLPVRATPRRANARWPCSASCACGTPSTTAAC